ncbi:MAG TPA: two-component sensor histidine kinase, partial [Micromonospora sp.]
MSSSPPTEHRGWRTRPSRLRWRGPGGWSLRARLVATVSVLLAVVCLTVGATTEFALHRVLYHQIDERLAASAGRRPPPATEYRPAPQPADTPPEFTRGQQVGTLLALVVDGELRSGAVLDESADVRELGDEVAPTLAEVPTDGRPRSYDLPKLGDYRLVARQLPDGAVLVTGLPLAEVRAVLYGVAAVTGAVTLLALVVAGAAGA